MRGHLSCISKYRLCNDRYLMLMEDNLPTLNIGLVCVWVWTDATADIDGNNKSRGCRRSALVKHIQSGSIKHLARPIHCGLQVFYEKSQIFESQRAGSHCMQFVSLHGTFHVRWRRKFVSCSPLYSSLYEHCPATGTQIDRYFPTYSLNSFRFNNNIKLLLALTKVLPFVKQT